MKGRFIMGKIGFILLIAVTAISINTCKKFRELPLAVSTQKSTDVTLTTAFLNGFVNGFGGYKYVKAYFKWGLSAENLNKTTPSKKIRKSRPYHYFLKGLTSNTTYYFQAFVENGIDIARGSVLAFKTAAAITDYFRVYLNPDGSLSFANTKNGESILESSPQFYFNYGKTIETEAGLVNGSFEADENGNNIPAHWKVNKKYITISSKRAKHGQKSLKFNMIRPEKDAKTASSSTINIVEDKFYTISFDYYLRSFASGGWSSLRVYICYSDGSSWHQTQSFTELNDLYCFIPTTVTGSWQKKTFTWIPPADAHSFYILFYVDSDTVASLYVDNVRVIEKGYDYTSNGRYVENNISVDEDLITITSVDDSNAYVKVMHQYKMKLNSPYINYSAVLEYKQDVRVSEERFDFIVPSHKALVMGRDLRLTDFDTSKVYYSDLYSPKVAKFDNGLYFLGSDTMESMRLKKSGKNSQLSYYADYLLNHPHFYFPAKAEIARMDESKRLMNSIRSVSVNFAVSPDIPIKSLVKTRQPYGYDAVLTLTSHPDDWTYETTKAIAYGSTDEKDEKYGIGGIIGRGIGWTYGVFTVKDRSSVGLDDPSHKKLVDKMFQDGVEVAPHTIKSYTESREEVVTGLQLLTQYRAKNWIDHSASTAEGNFEAIKSQGALKGKEHYILDLLDRFNYKYAWSYIDFPTDRHSLNILVPSDTSAIRPVLFYNNNVDNNIQDEKRIYLWSTINTGKEPELFYTPDRVDDLIRERGVHISHEYYGYPACKNHAYYEKEDRIEISPEFDSQLKYMAKKISEDLLWSPTMSTLGDYLVPLKDILVTYNEAGKVIVTNNSPKDMTGITLLAEESIQSVNIDHYALVSFGELYGNREIVLPTLASGNSAVLEIVYGERDPSIPVISSLDSEKKKVKEISGYWDALNQTLIMTAEALPGNYSFHVRIPSLAGKIIQIKDVTANTFIGEYKASPEGEITFAVLLSGLRTLEIKKSISQVKSN